MDDKDKGQDAGKDTNKKREKDQAPPDPKKDAEDKQWADAGITFDASLNFPECKWIQAVNWHPKFTGTFGYLMSWSGETPLTADLVLVDPSKSPEEDNGDPDGPPPVLPTIKCVGVIEKFLFSGAPDDPITIVAHVSSANASTIYGMYKTDGSTPPDPGVTVQWNIWTCEGAGEGWYQAAWTSGPVSAKVATDEKPMNPGGNFRVNVADKCSEIKDTNLSASVDIRLFRFGFQIMPTPGGGTPLLFQRRKTANIVISWGALSGA